MDGTVVGAAVVEGTVVGAAVVGVTVVVGSVKVICGWVCFGQSINAATITQTTVKAMIHQGFFISLSFILNKSNLSPATGCCSDSQWY